MTQTYIHATRVKLEGGIFFVLILGRGYSVTEPLALSVAYHDTAAAAAKMGSGGSSIFALKRISFPLHNCSRWTSMQKSFLCMIYIGYVLTTPKIH